MTYSQALPFGISILKNASIIKPKAFHKEGLSSFKIGVSSNYLLNPDGDRLLNPDGNPVEKN